jgi:hypothetical protein
MFAILDNEINYQHLGQNLEGVLESGAHEDAGRSKDRCKM